VHAVTVTDAVKNVDLVVVALNTKNVPDFDGRDAAVARRGVVVARVDPRRAERRRPSRVGFPACSGDPW
jgi:hypothetical protein